MPSGSGFYASYLIVNLSTWKEAHWFRLVYVLKIGSNFFFMVARRWAPSDWNRIWDAFSLSQYNQVAPCSWVVWRKWGNKSLHLCMQSSWGFLVRWSNPCVTTTRDFQYRTWWARKPLTITSIIWLAAQSLVESLTRWSSYCWVSIIDWLLGSLTAAICCFVVWRAWDNERRASRGHLISSQRATGPHLTRPERP